MSGGRATLAGIASSIVVVMLATARAARLQTTAAPVASLIAVVMLAAPASAHRDSTPKRLHVELTCKGARLIIDSHLQPGAESRDFRLGFDRDRDGALSEAEQGRLSDALAELAVFGVGLELDGRPVPLGEPQVTRVDGVADPLTSGGELGVRVELSVPLSWGASERRLRVRARHKDPRFPVPLTVAIAPELAVGAAVADLGALRSRPTSAPKEGLVVWVGRGACQGPAGDER